MPLNDYLLNKFGPTMTPLDVAGVLHQSPSHVRALCQRGELPAVRIGNRWHVITCKFAEMMNLDR